MPKRSVLITLFLLLAPVMGLAEDESNLSKIKNAVNKNEADLKEIALKQKDLEVGISNKRKQLKDLTHRSQHLNNELKTVKENIVKVQDEIQGIQQKQTDIKQQSLNRFRALYLKRHDLYTAKLALLSNSSEFLRDAFFLSKFEEYDKKLLEGLMILHQARTKAVQEKKRLLVDRDALRESLKREERAIAAKIREEQDLQQKLKVEEVRKEKALVALRAEALRLETVVRSLTDDIEKTPLVHKKDILSAHGQAVTEKFEGEGLEKGKLLRPTAGHLVKKFGQKAAGFKGLVGQKGVEFSTAKGEGVFVVAAGKVIYKGEMPGYGKIVIVDHGRRFYSLYGRLGEIAVPVGAVLSAGIEIAKAPPSVETLYFEIRKEGKPLNPQIFYDSL